MPIWYSFRLVVVLGFREGNLYKLRGNPMSVVTSMSRETNKKG
jgi:hypothetical protein